MSQNKGYMAKIGLDTSGMDKQIRSLNSELKTIDKALKDNGDSAELNAQKYTVLQKQLEATQQKLKQLQQQEETAAQALKNGQITDAEYRAFRREVENAAASVKKLEEQINDVNDRTGNGKKQIAEWLNTFKGQLAADAVRLVAGAVTDLTGKLTDLVKESAAAYGQFEQLVGGVETLFENKNDPGDTSGIEKVLENADNAFRTAGISANNYMQQATAFSASLINDLKGDTEAAAEYVDTAIRDMSDNANKMGTDLQSIQNAYQGFAKQNYTMLDNLKLGYGGTKTEMKRLIDDANKLKEANGEAGDLTIEKLSDVIEAVHLVQQQLGITGTTAEEAAGTIEGSAKSAQAAWENLLVGLADPTADLDSLIGQFIEAKTIEIENLLPTVEHSIEGIAQAIDMLIPKLSEGSEITDKLIDDVGEKAPQLVINLAENILGSLPALADAGLTIAEKLISSIADNMPELIPQLVEIIGNLASTVISHASELTQVAIKLVLKLAEGLGQAVPQLLQSAGQIIVVLVTELSQFIVKEIPQLISMGSDVVDSIAKGLVEYDWTAGAEQAVNAMWSAIDTALADISGYETQDTLNKRLEEAEARLVEAKAEKEEAEKLAEEAEKEGEELTAKERAQMEERKAIADDYRAASMKQNDAILDSIMANWDLSRAENRWDYVYHWDKENYEEYWEEQRQFLETHKENTKEWWDAWNKNEKHFAEKAAKEQKEAGDKAKKAKSDAEKAEKEAAAERKKQFERSWEDSAEEYDLEALQKLLDSLDKESDEYRTYLKKYNKVSDDLAKQTKDAFKERWQAITDEAASKGWSDDWVNGEHRKLLEALDQDDAVQKEIYDDYLTKYEKDTREFQKKKDDIIKKLRKEGEKAAEELSKLYENEQGKISQAFTENRIVTDTSGKERLMFTDYKEKLRQLKAYQKNLEKIKDMGLSETHLKEIFAMDMDTRMKYISELISMGEGNRAKYLSDYEAFQEAARNTSVSEVDFFNKSEVDKITGSVSEAISNAGADSYMDGAAAAAEYARGWNDTMKESGFDSLAVSQTMAAVERYGGQAGSTKDAVLDALGGNITINVAGTQAIKAAFGDILRAMKNSNGVLDE